MTSENDLSQLNKRDFLRFLFDGGQNTIHILDAAAADVPQDTEFEPHTSYNSDTSLDTPISAARTSSTPTR